MAGADNSTVLSSQNSYCVLDSNSSMVDPSAFLFSPKSFDKYWHTVHLPYVENSKTHDLLSPPTGNSRINLVKKRPRSQRSFDLNKIARTVGPVMRHLAFNPNYNITEIPNVLNGVEEGASRVWSRLAAGSSLTGQDHNSLVHHDHQITICDVISEWHPPPSMGMGMSSSSWPYMI